MDKKPIAFSGSHWRVTLEDSPISVTDNYNFNYNSGLGNDKFPIDLKSGNPRVVCIGGTPDSRDYIDILYMLSDNDDSRFLTNSGNTIKFLLRCFSAGQGRSENIYEHTLTNDFMTFNTGALTYGYLPINKRIYLNTVPNYKSIDLFILGINVPQGGSGNECSVAIRHTKFL